MLQYRRPAKAIARGNSLKLGFGFPGLGLSQAIRDYTELRSASRHNPAFVRNIVAHYLRVCGLSTEEVGTFLDITPSRVSKVSATGRKSLYPARGYPRYVDKPSYSPMTARAESLRWTSRHDHLRGHHPRDPQALAAHLLQQALEEKVDAEDALAHCLDMDSRSLVAAAFELGRQRLQKREEALADAACLCSDCDRFRRYADRRDAEAAELEAD